MTKINATSPSEAVWVLGMLCAACQTVDTLAEEVPMGISCYGLCELWLS